MRKATDEIVAELLKHSVTSLVDQNIIARVRMDVYAATSSYAEEVRQRRG